MADEIEMTNETDETAESIEELRAENARLKKDNEKLKQATTNASSEAAKYKKEMRDRMTEQERKAEEEAEEKRKMAERIAELEADRRNEKGKAGFIGLGFEESAAVNATKAFYEGNAEAFTALLKGFLAEHDKGLKAESVRGMTPPASGGTQHKYTKEDFDKMSYRELNDLYQKNPELYQELKNT